MLESVIVNLADKLGDETRILKEDSKAIQAEIKTLKPSFSDLFKNRGGSNQPAGPLSNHPSGRHGQNESIVRTENLPPLGRETVPIERRPKRSRTGEGIFALTESMETADEVFDDLYQTQGRIGFLGDGQHRGGSEEQVDQQRNERGDSRIRKPTWRQKFPNITGVSNDKSFAAPVDLFLFNVNKEVTEEAMKSHMKNDKQLELIECLKISHDEARTKSFRVKVKAEDYEKAMSVETWSYRVRVRPYRHFKPRCEQAGQFSAGGAASGQDSGVRDGSNQHS